MSVIRLGLLDVSENNLLIYFSPPALYLIGEILEREQGTRVIDSFGIKPKVHHLLAIFF